MSFLDRLNQAPSGGASLTDVVTQFKNLVQNVAQIQQAIANVAPRTFGSFTLGPFASTTVPETSTQSQSVICLMPTNAAAATLMGSNKALYTSARTAGASFVVTTASGAAAAGTETFSYVLWNPS